MKEQFESPVSPKTETAEEELIRIKAELAIANERNSHLEAELIKSQEEASELRRKIDLLIEHGINTTTGLPNRFALKKN